MSGQVGGLGEAKEANSTESAESRKSRGSASLLPARDPEMMAVEPQIIKRACPGFLAIAGYGSPIRFAVEGDTAAEAYANFVVSREKWAILRAMP